MLFILFVFKTKPKQTSVDSSCKAENVGYEFSVGTVWAITVL